MKSVLFFGLLTIALSACSGGDSALTVTTSQQRMLLIPSAAPSCTAIKTAAALVPPGPPSFDIAASWFRIPTLTFTKKNIDKDLYITLVRITVTLPSGTKTWNFGGNDLAALSSDPNWWPAGSKTGGSSKIAAGTPFLTTDCPVYCGGIDTSKAFTANATMDIFGFEQAGTSEPDPVKTTTTFIVESPF